LIRPLAAVVLLAASALGAAACGDDDGGASGGGANGQAQAELSVVVEHPDVDTVRYTIECGVDGASLRGDDVDVDAEAACLALAEGTVVRLLVHGPPEDQVCTEIYGGPDVATITGTLGGESVDRRIDRVNGCGITTWDDVLGDVLPPARAV
jgi:hypothetical protein